MMKIPQLAIHHLSASIGNKQILFDVSCRFEKKNVTVIMGPNGSGKSTLAHVVMGDPTYKDQRSKIKDQKKRSKIKDGTVILLNGYNITNMPVEKRARMGLFLSFQTPIAIPGVIVMELLRSTYQKKNLHPQQSVSEFMDSVSSIAKTLNIETTLLHRGIHEGFSGGERKKIELLQALVIQPDFAFFDEIDTGVDIDSIKLIASGIRALQKRGAGIILITHNERILDYIHVDRVYIMKNGRIVKEGKSDLIGKIKKSGYKKYA